MKKKYIFIIIILLFLIIINPFSLNFKSRNFQSLYWGESFQEMDYNFSGDFHNYYSYCGHYPKENAIIYALSIKPAHYMNNKKVQSVFAYFWQEKLYKLKIVFTNTTSTIIYDEQLLQQAADEGKKLAPYTYTEQQFRDFYWGENYFELNAQYKMQYAGGYKTENAVMHWIYLNNPVIDGKILVDNKILAYFWNSQLYRIEGKFTDGSDFVMYSDYLTNKIKNSN